MERREFFAWGTAAAGTALIASPAQSQSAETKMPISMLRTTVTANALHKSVRVLQGVGTRRDAYDAFTRIIEELDSAGVLQALPRTAVPGDARIVGDALRALPNSPFTADDIASLESQVQQVIDSAAGHEAEIAAAVDGVGGWANALATVAADLYDLSSDPNPVPALRTNRAQPRVSASVCFYSGWGLMYASWILVPLTTPGGVIAAAAFGPEVVPVIAASMLTLNILHMAAC